MEYVFTDVNEAFPVMWQRMHSRDGVFERNSRNGRVLESVSPVTLTYTQPRRRVLFSPARDANPFFHVMEAIWMLAGRSDVHWLTRFNPRMADYSDDGRFITGSNYGARWRINLPHVIADLRRDRDTRRAYLPIFNFNDDNQRSAKTKDLPCNVGVHFLVRHDRLDMTVFNRSNDMIWGSLGANYVHFGFFQEYVAALCDLRVGSYSQISACFHLYPDFDVCKRIAEKPPTVGDNFYDTHDIGPSTLRVLNARTDKAWQEDAAFFLDEYAMAHPPPRQWWHDPFFARLAVPMLAAWRAYKDREYEKAIALCADIDALDWQIACRMWIQRRMQNAKSKSSVGTSTDAVA